MTPNVAAAKAALSEQYADPVLHREFLSTMIDHSQQFVFVLNQVDRLGDQSALAVESLERRLDADGFDCVPVVTTVASPDVGVDVTALRSELDRRWDRKATALRAMALDMRGIAAVGWQESGAAAERGGGDAAAVAGATFVSLGVAAYELHHRLSGDSS